MVKISNEMISMVKHQLPILATSNRCSYTKKCRSNYFALTSSEKYTSHR